MPIIYKRYCNYCGEYYEKPSAKYFCSKSCKGFAITNKTRKLLSQKKKGKSTYWLKGKPSWNKGKTNYWCKGNKNPNKNGNNSRGDKAWNWKVNNINYGVLHSWVRRHKGKPIKCEQCGKCGEIINGRWNIQWANTNHKYKRNLTDWLALCVPCHFEYDKKFSKKNC